MAPHTPVTLPLSAQKKFGLRRLDAAFLSRVFCFDANRIVGRDEARPSIKQIAPFFNIGGPRFVVAALNEPKQKTLSVRVICCALALFLAGWFGILKKQ
jgi:hypothetical protein